MHADDVGMCPDMDDAILELAHRELVTTCAGIGGARDKCAGGGTVAADLLDDG
jgi:hypothetical protein